VKRIKIESCFVSRFGRRNAGYLETVMEAVRGVLATADLTRIRDIYVASYAPSELCQIEDPFNLVARAVASEFPDLRCRYHGLFKTGADALHRALVAMGDGGSHASPEGDVLVVGAEKMTHLDPPAAAGLLSARENPHDRAYGATLPALGALVTRAYLREFDIPETALHRVAVKNHRHGAMNPRAQFRRAVTVEEVAQSPLVADPLRRLHCAPISDGAASLLLTRGAGGVAFIGWGNGADTRLFQDRRDITRFAATARATRQSLECAGVTNSDINVVEIHDAFSSFELINLEEMGFYPKGMSWRALENGDLHVGGKIAVNPSGGMKAKGHPIGACGISSCVEVYQQLTGSAGDRQHNSPRLGMVQSVGGVSDESFIFIMRAE
jgi:acetyl-CoA acetyltransferase